MRCVGSRVLRLGALWVASALGVSCAPPPEEAPFDGRTRFQRICSVTVATDEMLTELVPQERMAGVSYMADDPSTSNVAGVYADSIPRVDANLEMILATEPDLVLVASYSQKSFTDMLRRAGVRTFHYDINDSFVEIMKGMLVLGRVVGEPVRAGRLVDDMRSRLSELEARIATVPVRPRVFYWARGWTAGAGTNVGEMIERAGGINAAAEMGIEGHPAISLECVLAADPDILLIPLWDASYGGEQDAFPEVFQYLTAVREGRVLRIDGRHISTVSHFLVDGTEQLARMLHPEAFDDSDTLPGD